MTSTHLNLLGRDESIRVPLDRDSRSVPELVRMLRGGESPRDVDFDHLYSEELRAASTTHWTPLRVALRAAEWLDELGLTSLVDVGSGPGKLSVAVALASRCRVVGIEQRPRFVEAARELADCLGVTEQVDFIEGTFGETELPRADAYYTFNPFGENRFQSSEWLDADVELSQARFARDVEAFELFLRDAPLGTHLITYNGFGGRVPSCYRRVRSDQTLPCVLRMWRKANHDRGDWPTPDTVLSMLDQGTQGWHDDG